MTPFTASEQQLSRIAASENLASTDPLHRDLSAANAEK